MAVKLGDAFVRIFGDDTDLDRSFDQAKGKTNAFANVLQGVLQGVGQRLFDAITSGLNRFVSEIQGAIDKSSDLAESITKTSTVFADSADDVLQWSKNSATAFGQSRQQALEAASSFGNMFVAMGMAREEAAAMSMDLVELASDIASINNIDPSEALQKLRAGLVGEAEPLRTVGVLLSEAAVQAKAMEMGLAANANQLTESDKVLARYQIILEQTAVAQGDFERNALQAANAGRIFDAQMENAAATLGNLFRPAYEAIINTLIELMPMMQMYAENIMASFANGLASAIRYVTPVLLQIKQIFSYWLQPGSPPRLLPDLTRWGAGALQAWLDGFKPTAVKAALGSVGRSIEAILRSFVATGQMDKTDLVTRVLGSREAIERAVREFSQIGRVSSETMAAIIRNAGPAGASVAGLVRAFFDLEGASRRASEAQDKLNQVTEYYDNLISPLQADLSANQAEQQAIRDAQRVGQLERDIAEAMEAQARAAAAAQEIEEIRARQQRGDAQNWFEQVADAERLLELQRIIDEAGQAESDAALARLEIEEIELRQKLATQEEARDLALEQAQKEAEAAEAAKQAAEAALQQEQAIIDLQLERNRLIAEEIALQEELEQARLDAIKKAEEERKRAEEEARRELERQQKDAEAVARARFEYEFSIADTPQQLEMLQEKLAQTEAGTVEYYRTLQQLSQLQERYAKELENPPLDAAAAAAERAAEAEFSYQLSIADTQGKLDLLRQKLSETEEGSAEYYQTLQQIAALDRQRVAEIDAVTDAQLGYQMAIADTPGKIELMRQQLAEMDEGSAEYFQTLTQIAQLEQQYQSQLDSEARREAAEAERERAKAQREYEAALKAGQRQEEQLIESEFRYKLALTDTAGQIALYREKLAGLQEGSVEWFDTLTTIVQLEERHKKELEAAANKTKALASTSLDSLGVNVVEPLEESTEAGENLRLAIEELVEGMNEPSGEPPDWVKGVAQFIQEDLPRAFDKLRETIDDLTRVIEERMPKLQQETEETAGHLNRLWEEHQDKIKVIRGAILAGWDYFTGEVVRKFDGMWQSVTSAFGLFNAAFSGDWDEFWRIIIDAIVRPQVSPVEAFRGWLSAFTGAFEAWLPGWLQMFLGWIDDYILKPITDRPAQMREAARLLMDGFITGMISDSLSALGDAGANIATAVWDGIKGEWWRVDSWFRQKLAELRNLLPFSEPKDPTSPLRGLVRSGESIVEMLQVGIDRASLSMDPFANRLLPAPTSLPSTAAAPANNITFNVEVTIEGDADEEDVRNGVNLGIADAMRQQGLAVT